MVSHKFEHVSNGIGGHITISQNDNKTSNHTISRVATRPQRLYALPVHLNSAQALRRIRYGIISRHFLWGASLLVHIVAIKRQQRVLVGYQRQRVAAH